MIGKIVAQPDWSTLESRGVKRGSKTGRIVTMKVPLDVFASIDFDRVYEYMEIPGKVAPHLDRARKDVRADSVQLGLNLPEAYTGKNVIIGVTDWGFDYTHPMFYDTLYQSTRIIAAWDQYKTSGNMPSGYNYGAVYNGQDELFAAQSDTANIYSYAYHGSHVAGIAGGSGGTTNYRGMAPEAQFLFTTFLVDYASVIDAFNWMKDIAAAEGKPLVVNMSWGLYWIGTLDGNSLLSQAIDDLSDQGVLFVASAGNNGDATFHIKKNFNNDALTTRITFDTYTNPNMWGESITMWGEESHAFKAKLRIYNTANTLVDETPLYDTQTAQAYLDSMLVIGSDTIFFNLTSEAAHPLNNRPHMRLRVKNTNGALKVILYSEATSGIVHYWNLVELITEVGNWGLPFAVNGNIATSAGDANYSISEPTCTASVVSVAAYASQYINAVGFESGGQIANFSSIGPLMTEVVKPDIAAPGVNVVSSISSFTDADITPSSAVIFNGENYPFAPLSGTSMASPCVTGVAALVLDANPLLTPAQVKTILKETAREDDFTGNITTPPGDLRWGYGKLNAMHAVQLALQTQGLGVEYMAPTQIRVYPNPASDLMTMEIPAGEKCLSVIATDMSGKQINLYCFNNQVDVSTLAGGIYSIEIRTDRELCRAKMMIAQR